ncbi:uncharacterized protein LOC106874462 [Octopus bimaculoides]|uniref:uncharacterized protein LOC106874462 n=1 Tax=Octopus bimaculoides TaxID=37653 RepID=UPI00071E4FDE|nr:uncharacterized protein LOC106874462 [Octopus bimaculoides]|eukprot:XP_014777686.1 PREDICTED: uncharacterized protein LOC106874462 [Octopus bimaculoides]
MVFSLQKWGFEFEDEQKESHSKEFDSKELKAVVPENPISTCRELAEQLNIAHTTVLQQQKRIEKVSVVGKWVLHELSPENLQQCVLFVDLAPYDYHLFQGLQNHLNGLRLASRKKAENESDSYFTAKPKQF